MGDATRKADMVETNRRIVGFLVVNESPTSKTGLASEGFQMAPFIHERGREGVGGSWPLGRFADGPFPEHYEPIGKSGWPANALHPTQSNNPRWQEGLKTAADKYAKRRVWFQYGLAPPYRPPAHYHKWNQKTR